MCKPAMLAALSLLLLALAACGAAELSRRLRGEEAARA